MDEMNTPVVSDAPQADAAQTASSESEIPTTEISSEDGATTQDAQTQETEGSAVESSDAEVQQEESEPEFVVPVQFNHQYQELSVSEASEWVQKGMQAESLMADLRYLAAANNQSVAEVVKTMTAAHEDSIRAQLKEKCSDDNLIEQLMEAERRKYRESADRLAEGEQQARKESVEETNRRLAKEFLDLKKEFPDVPDFAALPKQVLKMSQKQGISLLDGYLRYQHTETKKAKASEAQQKEAARSSAGSLQSNADEGKNDVIAAMLAGIAGKAY